MYIIYNIKTIDAAESKSEKDNITAHVSEPSASISKMSKFVDINANMDIALGTGSDSTDDNQNPLSDNDSGEPQTVVTSYYSPTSTRRLEKELMEMSPNSVERSEMEFKIGVDRKLVSASSESDIRSGPQTPSFAPNLVKSDLFVNIVSGDDIKIEKSEYFSPGRIEKELTPDDLTLTVGSCHSTPSHIGSNSLSRSELHLQLSGQKTAPAEDLTQCFDIELSGEDNKQIAEDVEVTVNVDLLDSAVTESPSQDVCADITIENIEPTTADTQNCQVNLSPAGTPGSSGSMLDVELLSIPDEGEASSVSSGGIEYSRTQTTETEEMIETSVSNSRLTCY